MTQEKLKEYFKYNKVDELFETSDGMVFVDEIGAKEHSKSLKSKIIKRYCKNDIIIEKKSNTTFSLTKEELLEIEDKEKYLEPLKFDELKNVCEVLEIELPKGNLSKKSLRELILKSLEDGTTEN